MTSKEALKETKQIILNNAKKRFIKDFVILNNNLNIIEKDLEILEILKPIIKAVVELKGVSINSMDFKVSDNVKEIIKRWIDNDK